MLNLKPDDCPKFQTCNSPVCPLDPGWPGTAHLEGEPVCRYLLASGKEGAADHFGDDAVFGVVLGLAPAMAARFGAIRREMEKSSRSGFRGANLRRRAAQGAGHAGRG